MAKIPEHLSKEMKKFYKDTCSSYNLEPHHLIILCKACECLDRSELARLEVEKDGLVVSDRYGSLKPHPCVKMELDNKNTARLLLRELALDIEPSEAGRAPRLY